MSKEKNQESKPDLKWIKQRPSDWNNAAIKVLITKHGISTYGIYHRLRELIAENGGQLCISDWTLDSLAFDLRVDTKILQEHISLLTDKGVFYIKNKDDEKYLLQDWIDEDIDTLVKKIIGGQKGGQNSANSRRNSQIALAEETDPVREDDLSKLIDQSKDQFINDMGSTNNF